MTFAVKWSFMNAGEAVLEVLPMARLNGTESYHFVFSARTNEFVDLIYKVRDRIDSYADSGMTRSILYMKKREGKSKRDVIVTFDWDKHEAQYSNFGEKIEPIAILPGTFDPLSVFFAFRLFNPDITSEITVPVTDGKKNVIGKARKIKKEAIEVAGVSYNTLLFEPEISDLGGVFQKSPNARLLIWVTDDHRHIPVKIKSKVIVGSFVAELVSVENGNSQIK